jgi:hypothetical protein
MPIGNVVQDRNADLEGHHPVVSPADQEDGRLDDGEVLCVVVRPATGGARFLFADALEWVKLSATT